MLPVRIPESQNSYPLFMSRHQKHLKQKENFRSGLTIHRQIVPSASDIFFLPKYQFCS